MSSSEGRTQNELKGIFVYFLSQIALTGHLLTSLVFCLCIIECVCTCVSCFFFLFYCFGFAHLYFKEREKGGKQLSGWGGDEELGNKEKGSEINYIKNYF